MTVYVCKQQHGGHYSNTASAICVFKAKVILNTHILRNSIRKVGGISRFIYLLKKTIL